MKKTDKTDKLIYKKLSVDDSKERQSDMMHAKTILVWEQMVYRAEGLKKTNDYFITLQTRQGTKLTKELLSI